MSAMVKSAARVLELLEFAQQFKEPFKAIELRNALDWPASSTQMLLETVVESGYLIFNGETKQYFPSPRLLALGDWHSSPECDWSGAFDVLDEIAEATGEHVALSILNNCAALCLKFVPGQTPIPMRVPAGFQAPLTRSAAGLAILTVKSDGQAMSTIQKSRELAAAGRESYALTMNKIHQFRREGRAIVYGRVWAESCWISVPTPRSFNMVPGSISVGGSVATMQRREEVVTEALLSAVSRWARKSSASA